MRLFPIPYILYPVPFFLLLCAAAGVPAFADETININNPSAGTGWTFSGNVVTITANGNYTVTGTTTANRIVINKDVTATITLNNATIHSAVASPFMLSSDNTGGSDVTLILSGSNELVTTSEWPESPAALTVENNAKIRIEGAGSLTASGGEYAAGIGGGIYGSGGNITVTGGTITAIGGYAGAGIGGGFEGNGGNITVNGGTITATGGEFAAGIGGGGNAAGGNITITGGTVTATAGRESAGIGGGQGGNGGNITITGGTITATGGASGAGMGGGWEGDGGKISISNGIIVSVTSGGTGDPAGIGGGGGAGAGTVTVTGGTVYASGGTGPGIGGGTGATGGDIRITGGTVIADKIGFGNGSTTATTLSGANTVVLSPSINATTYGGATVLTGDNVSVSNTITIGDAVADVTLNAALTIPGGATLVVPAEIVFDVNSKALTNNGVIREYGTLKNANQRSGNPAVGAIQPDWITIPAQTYTGSAIEPDVTVKSGDFTLTRGVYYAVASYDGNINAGTASVTITDLGNNHPVTKTFTIAQMPLAAEWLTIPDSTYTGNPITPAITVTYGSRILKEGTDYIYLPVDSKNAGPATVTITGTGNYTGTVSKNFTILPKALAAGWIANIPAQSWTGDSVKPAIVVRDGSTTLTLNTDYTVSYTDNVNIGTATATVTGKVNYTGTADKTFTIKTKALADGWIDSIPPQTYTGDSIKPAVVVRDGSKELALNTDYTVAYTDNVNAGTGTVTVTGMGYYAGTIVKSFAIAPKALAAGSIQDIPAQPWTGDTIIPAVVVRDGSRTLAPDTDYTITYSNIVNAGVVTVRVIGKGNYFGNAYGYFDILPRQIATEWLEDVPPQVWTGEAIEPAVTVRDGDGTLTPGTDYKVTYANNVNVGSEAWVSVTGMGNYTGTKSKMFSIVSPPTDTVPTSPPADTVPKAVTGVSFYNDSYIVEKGQTLQLFAVIVPADAGNRNVSWATSNKAVATVSGGRVTAVSAGEATITVTTDDGGYRDTCLIRVPGIVTTKDTVIYQKIIFYERDTLYLDTTVYRTDTLYTDTTVHRVDTLYRDTTLYLTDTLYRDTTVYRTDTLYNDTVIYVVNIVQVDSIDYNLVPDTVYVVTDITGAEYAVTETARVVRVGTVLRIEGLTPGKTFSIYTIKGEKYYSGTAQSDVFRLNNMPAGIYILYHNGQYSKFSY